jgi:DNA-directed RNA polymerase subunit F
MERNFRKTPAAGAGASPPSEAWLFAQAVLGKPVPSPFRAEADARARREHLEWLAQISPEDARRVRGQLSEEADAKAQRKHLEWLAEISPEHEVKLRALQRAEAEASDAREHWEWLAEVSTVQEGTWDPSQHPRASKGQPDGGQWVATGGSGPTQVLRRETGQAPAKSDQINRATQLLHNVTNKEAPPQTPHSNAATPARSGDTVRVSFHAGGEVPDILNPASKNSVSRSFWEALRSGDWRKAEDIIDDIAHFLDETKLRSVRTAIKQIRGLVKWRKQASKWRPKRIRDEIETLKKTLNDHLAKRGGLDTPETVRFRYQLDYLKGLLK